MVNFDTQQSTRSGLFHLPLSVWSAVFELTSPQMPRFALSPINEAECFLLLGHFFIIFPRSFLFCLFCFLCKTNVGNIYVWSFSTCIPFHIYVGSAYWLQESIMPKWIHHVHRQYKCKSLKTMGAWGHHAMGAWGRHASTCSLQLCFMVGQGDDASCSIPRPARSCKIWPRISTI